MPFRPLGYEQLTSLGSATGLTVPKEATHARIQAEDNNVRWRDDGTSPTATVGMVLLAAGGEAEGIWYNGELENLEFIEETASAKLNVAYYG